MTATSSDSTQDDRQKLIAAERLLAAIVENSDDAIIGKTLDGTITSWNAGAERLYGYTAAEMVGRPIATLIPAGQPDELPVILARLARGERIKHFETRRRRKDGTLLTISLTISPIRDEGGRIVGASAIARDITERTRLERALRRSAALVAGQKRVLDEIVQGASLARVLDTLVRVVEEQADGQLFASILLLDESGERLVHGAAPSLPAAYNQAIDGTAIGPRAGSCGTAAFLRKPVVVDDIASDPLWEDFRGLALPHGLRACWSTPIAGSNGGILGTFALYHREPHRPTDDERHLVELVAHTAAVAIERSRAEAERGRLLLHIQAARAEAEQERNRLDTVTRNATLALFMTDRRQYTTFMNPAAELMTGFTLDEMRERPLHDLLHHTRPDGSPYPPAECPIDGALHLGRRSQGEEVFIHKDGRFYPVAFTASPIMERGQSVGTVLELEDISARRALEREREGLLERERHARAEAEAANQAKDEFLSVLSHELRTPLTPILGFLGMLKRPDLSEERRRVALEMMERSAQAEARLVEDLLDVSRIVAGKLLLERELTDLGPVVEAAVETVQPLADAKGVTLTLTAENVRLAMFADAGRLQQVVWNLLSNAVKFTPAGGSVSVTLRREGERAVITVQDTGAGIAPALLPMIFERFHQADASSTRVHGGLGLGLTIARHLVEEHGGAITATSPGEGQGATFTVRLPLQVERPPATASSQDAEHAMWSVLAGRRVLVVDDDPATRLWLQAALESAGMRVILAASAQTALTLLESAMPDLLLVDLAMPEVDGIAFLTAVRSRPDAAGPPAVAFTAYASAEDRQRALAAGFDAHLAKPADPDALLSTLADALSTPHRRK